MVNSFKSIIILASALCFLSLLGLVYGQSLKVEGTVYCDTCRTQFITRLSEMISGAKVRLQCRDRAEGNVTYSVEGETDKAGRYILQVPGDHQSEICETMLVKSSRADCNEINEDPFVRLAARISLIKNNDLASQSRKVNPLGFMKKEPLPECAKAQK